MEKNPVIRKAIIAEMKTWAVIKTFLLCMQMFLLGRGEHGQHIATHGITPKLIRVMPRVLKTD